MTELDALGFAVADVALSEQQCDHIASAIPAVTGGRGGVRGLVGHPTVLQLLLHQRLGEYVWSAVGRELVAVKATLFDKTAESNWRVQWHQDRVIAVRERMDVAGYGPWSTKAGVLHVEPPASVLEQMLAVRLYLDECGPANGPMQVLPGSHEWGKIPEEELQDRVAGTKPVEVHAAKGALVLMRPLLVHSSSLSRDAGHRRVLHIELAPAEAISPLQWQTAIHLRRAA
ncbi:MAG TPA: phytanoyl-CoA dioxygenase family protein [Thermoanaerobaculia bacterium]|nr:phytanoyl-CoA dioxygenase family protein [Thermoanaerobaculia bacterium]